MKLCGTRAEEQVGTVVYPRANIDVEEDGNRVRLESVSLATYDSQPSDSGAPIIAVVGGQIVWLGIHGGALMVEGQRYAWFTPLATINSAVPIYNADQEQSAPAVTLDVSAEAARPYTDREERSLVASFSDALLAQSRWTWNMIKMGYNMGKEANLVPEEDTLTQMNLLFILGLIDDHSLIHVHRSTPQEENENGADWIWVFLNQFGYQVTVYIQAKKIDIWKFSPNYPELKLAQATALINTAQAKNAHAIYVFYNFSPEEGDPALNGCMVTFAEFTRRVMIQEGYNKYDDLLGYAREEPPRAWPWTALVTLPSIGDTTIFERVRAWLEQGYAAMNMSVSVQPQPVEQYVVDILAGRPVNYPIPGNPKAIMIVNEGFAVS